MRRDEFLHICSFVEQLKNSGRTITSLGAPEPLLEMALFLIRQRLEGKSVTMSSLAASSGVPYATAIRRIHELLDKGLIVRRARTRTGKSFTVHPTQALVDEVHLYALRIKTCLNYLNEVGVGQSDTSIASHTRSRMPTFRLTPSSSEQLNIYFQDTSRFAKNPPYVLGFSNAGLGDRWRVELLHNVEKAASDYRPKIRELVVANAFHQDEQQICDIHCMLEKHVDAMIVSANSQYALDSTIAQVMSAGVPVITVDRGVASADNCASFVAPSDTVVGRLFAQWLAEKIGGRGGVLILGGSRGSSVNDLRLASALEVLSRFTRIQILDMQYSNWDDTIAQEIVGQWIRKFGKKIKAILSADGIHNIGVIQAFLDAGYRAGEIPPITSSNVTEPLDLAIENKIPMLDISNPPDVGYVSVEVALQVLSGVRMPSRYHVAQQIVVTNGDETQSVKADYLVKSRIDVANLANRLLEREHHVQHIANL